MAAAHQISTRSLYKLFQEEGLTVAAWVRERRLENCRRALADPALNSRPVHAIAARWGFADSAHFSRAFRAAYGMPPKEYRQLTRLGADVREPSKSVQGQSTT
ncbi:helix-turn-helix domain-containing protein [Streptomyces sp. YIM B13518]|uniref:helix-turn-helix domain-containing protein n=1 Tax=Streptomyces sp. YIM B13518 TaxID=3366316 RepID=UPI0036845238